ncbi:HpcH/HpaI aldolase/citrate lyase family protein [Allobacillus sp. GCM10007491]|uniref:CoA ester lyase n=1 Tax=Allobacillus saliphilus TaxID=2912308 RepID=A0A941CW78_9BACI|nr:CoA ester lyase [Allobacillus saliphilus]MBR7554809.1 CoA ester lyase [Allobacillus saliphilus]
MLNRSLLFVPADKEKMLRKINELQADLIIIDLEDAVRVDEKHIGRDLIRKYIGDWEKPVFIRVNSIETSEFQVDMQLILEISNAVSLQGVMLPKSSSRRNIEELAEHLETIENQGSRQSKLSIIPLIESALGVHNSIEIASSHQRVMMLAFGGVDFTTDIGAQITDGEMELLYARSKLVIASRCANIKQPIDTVYTNFKDNDGFIENCIYVKQLGFAGKLLIHPSQIKSANAVFSPSKEEYEFAQRLVSRALTEKGAFQLDGKMIDKPIIEKAERILNEYELIKSKI